MFDIPYTKLKSSSICDDKKNVRRLIPVDNNAKNLQYLEVDEQRSLSSDDYSQVNSDLQGGYLNKNISMFGKVFIGLMLLTFASAFLFLIFSYTPYGIDILRNLKFNII